MGFDRPTTSTWSPRSCAGTCCSPRPRPPATPTTPPPSRWSPRGSDAAESLELLRALTEADAKATSAKAWTLVAGRADPGPRRAGPWPRSTPAPPRAAIATDEVAVPAAGAARRAVRCEVDRGRADGCRVTVVPPTGSACWPTSRRRWRCSGSRCARHAGLVAGGVRRLRLGGRRRGLDAAVLRERYAAVLEGRLDPVARLRAPGGRGAAPWSRPWSCGPRPASTPPCSRCAPPTAPAWSTGVPRAGRARRHGALGPRRHARPAGRRRLLPPGGRRRVRSPRPGRRGGARRAGRADPRRLGWSLPLPDGRGPGSRRGLRRPGIRAHHRYRLRGKPPCSPHSPTASPTPSRTCAARDGSPRPTSTPPRARSASRCSRPTSRCRSSASSSPRSRTAPAARRSAGR